MSDRHERERGPVEAERESEWARETGYGRRRGGVLDRRVARVAATEVRRSVRRLLDDPAALVAMTVLAVGTATITAGSVAVGLFPARIVPGWAVDRLLVRAGFGGANVTRLVLARAAVAGVWVSLTVAMVSRVASVTGRLDAPAAVLLALSPRRAVLGVVGAEWLRAAGVLGPAVALSALVAGELAGRPTAATVGVAGTLVVGSAVGAGYPLGVGLKAVVEAARRRGVGWIRLVVAVGTAAVVGGAAVAATVGLPAVRPLALVAGLPPGGLADLALGPSADVADGGWALAGVGWALAGVVGGPLVASVAVERLWLTEPPRSAATEYPGGLGRVPAPPASLAVRAVVRAVWLRTLRAPVKLVYTLYPVGGIVALWLDPSARAQILGSLYVYVPLYAAWASGAGLGLNPLGDEGRCLPTVLTAVRGRSFVRGRLLAAALPGAALGGGVALVTAIGGGLPAVALPVGVVVAAALAGLAAAVAVAVGTVLPGFDSVRVSGSTTVVVPSFAASIAYFVALALLSTPGTLALLSVADLPTLLPDSSVAVAGAVGVQVGVTTLAVLLAGRSAAGRFDRYTVD